ncbi:MAG TPA: RimK family alpha-L-glutamate ligase [Mesorhizobium sp.]
MIPRILLISDTKRAGGLAAALRRRGAVVTLASLAEVRFDTTARHGLRFPGLGERLPDGVLVRSISAGSFEAITRRLGILHVLGRLGVPVWNTAPAIERCVDKSMTTFLLKDAGLATPDTFAVEGLDAARAVAQRELKAGPLVLKPLFGAQGRGIRLIEKLEDLPGPSEIADVYYLQRYIHRDGPPFHDFRVLVCDGAAVAMMRRRNGEWITNVNRGGVPELVDPEREAPLAAMAIAAAKAVGADFAGVDIMPDADGALSLLEVNSMPAWSGLQSVVGVKVARVIADAFIAHVMAGRRTAERPLRLVAPANS